MTKNKIILPSNIPFSDVIEGLTDTKVSPLYKDFDSLTWGYDPDMYIIGQIIEHIQLIITKKYLVFDGYNRINDFNDQVVKRVVTWFNTINGITYRILEKEGYGDMILTHYFDQEVFENDSVIIEEKYKNYYIEINCTTQNLDEIDTSSTYRYLYLSNMENIKQDGSHIIILIHFDKTDDRNQFKATDFKIFDLSKLKMNLKIEYNCSLRDILKLDSEVVKKEGKADKK
jgi:hypothetical protein